MAGIHITDIERAINWWRGRSPSADGIIACAEVRALAEVYALMVYYRQHACDEDTMPVRAKAGTIALDGEREHAFDHSDRVTTPLREGAFFTLDVARCMAVAARDGLLRQPRSPPDHEPDPRP